MALRGFVRCTEEIARIASDQTVSIRASLRVIVHRSSRSWSQISGLINCVACTAAPSGAADAVTACRSIGDGARFIALSNTRFSILVFEYSFSKPCSNIFEYSNNRFSTALPYSSSASWVLFRELDTPQVWSLVLKVFLWYSIGKVQSQNSHGRRSTRW